MFMATSEQFSSQSSLQPDKIVTGEIEAVILNLGGTKVSKIADKFVKEIDPYALITGGYLDQALHEIRTLLGSLDPEGTLLSDLSMISPSLTDPYFSMEDDWTLNNWVKQDEKMYCVGGHKNNSLVLTKDLYISKGQYLISIIVNSLPSGYLEIRKNGEFVAAIRETGPHYKEITIDDILTDEISFVGVNVAANDNIEVFSISIHYVAERFYEYLIRKIKSLSVVDTEGFVPREEYEHTLDVFLAQFQDATNKYLRALNMHTTANNPHEITPEKINAAPSYHLHDQYLTKTQVGDEVAEHMKNYAMLDHEHTEYLQTTAADALITSLLQKYLSELISVDPLIVTKAPVGVLPSRFAQTDINAPLQILLPSSVNHTDQTSFDKYGIITTNIESLMYEAPKVFAFTENYAIIPSSINPEETPINFRFCYHHKHLIRGYKIHVVDGLPSEWSVYSGNTTFIHKIMDSTGFVLEENGSYVSEVFFEKIEKVDSISFIISKGDFESDWKLRIELLYADFTTDEFGITSDEIEFCVPTSGTNRIIHVEKTLSPMKINPGVKVVGIPYYLYAGRELGDSGTDFSFSFYPPEYGNVRKGINVFLDKFTNIENTGSSRDEYIHPAFGTLSMKEGSTKTGSELKSIYDSSFTSWSSDGTEKKVTIEQTFNSDNVIMSGYMLNWRQEDLSAIPDAWTLTVEGRDIYGRMLTIVVDSVDQYYPFYSVEDDDIVYHKALDIAICVKKITLTMESKKSLPIMRLNKLYLFIGEYFYSIPQNTMYYGNSTKSRMCLGKVVYTGPEKGYEVTNACFGKSCVIPVNNLKPTGTFEEYSVPNPFFTTDVVASVQNYALVPDNSITPAAYITSITAEKITVITENSFRYAVSIARMW